MLDLRATLAECQFFHKDNPRIAYVEDNACRIAYLESDTSLVWGERSAEGSQLSLVYVLGWCYRIEAAEAANAGLTERDYREMIERTRNGLPPVSQDFSGNYVVLVYDRQLRKLAIQPDRWAMQAVYFSVSDKRVTVSNRSIAVASFLSAHFDGHSLLSHLRGVHIPFGRSLFCGVSRVMPGCYLEIKIDSAEMHLKRGYPIYVLPRPVNFRESIELVSNALRNVASRLINNRSAIFDLTGGNDTRLIAAAISRAVTDGLDPNFAWRVAGSIDDPDVRIATRIAALCNWPLLRLDRFGVRDVEAIEQLQRAAVYADGCSLVDSAFSRIQQELSCQDQLGPLVGSIGGELLRGFFWRHEMLSLGRTQTVNYTALLAYRLYASRGVDVGVFGRHGPSLRDHDEILLTPYRQIGEIGRDLLNPYKLDAMYLHKLCYNAGNPQSWLTGLRNIRLPFLSWETTRVALSIPWRARATRRLILKVIEGMNSQLAGIPNDKNEPMRPLSLVTLPAYTRVGMLAGARTLTRIVRRYVGRPPGNSTPSTDLPPPSWIFIIRDAKNLESMFERNIIRGLCRELQSGFATSDGIRLFYTLLTIELLLRQIPTLNKQISFGDGPAIV